ncbi:MAG: hypothetical protein IJY43_04180 [Clostridia bacterium]|nr:hypothetical protein [Clostridia bacterium]MBQ8859412.1 hypothetical protein [Clostridia bacterium]
MKSLYSLMLDDGVVAEIDRLAYLQNTNRSGLVNRILAEYASYVTPEQKIKEAFGRIQAVLDGQDSFRLAVEPSDTMLSLRSALLYKYNPTVRYSVELYRMPEGEVGELRVSLRTQNRTLILYMMQFYELWTRIEIARLGSVSAQAQEGKYTRRLAPRQVRRAAVNTVAPAALGELIAAYIRAFDAALKIYFRFADSPAVAAREVEAIYDAYLQESNIIL